MKTISLVLLIISSSVIAQSLADYYPLQVGNKWFYKNSEYNVGTTPIISYSSKEIVGDTIMQNGIEYYIVLEGTSKHYERFDTLTNEIRYYELSNCTGNDIAKYSLNYIKDSIVTWESCYYMTYNISFEQSQLSDTSQILLRGDGLVSENVLFSKYTGIIMHNIGEISYSTSYLIGARINGKEWGQLTNASDIYELTSDYNLEQNYPNPFNPTTTIGFTIKKGTRTKLNIYNSLGQLLTTVLDKELLKGHHKITFDGSNYSSGVYFYQLVTNDYISTKKFILMK